LIGDRSDAGVARTASAAKHDQEQDRDTKDKGENHII